jgi:hypothetical protein
MMQPEIAWQPGGAHDLERLTAALQSSPTGLALLNGAVVLPITATARTETVGVAQGSVNVYRSGASRFLQVFDRDGTGAPAWFKVELT